MAADIAEEIKRRKPKIQYANTNGFLDPSKGDKRPQGKEAVNARMLANYILDHEGSYFPSLDQMKTVIDETHKPETTASMKKRIGEVEEQHDRSLTALCQHYAWQYNQDALDSYYSYDDALTYDHRAGSRRATSFLHASDDAISRLQYSHLQTVIPLHRRYQVLVRKENEQRERLDRQFPQSVTEFRQIANKDRQLRVARFLASSDDPQKQEATMNEYGWAWRQVKPLNDQYKADEHLREEVAKLLREAITPADPRRRVADDPRRRGSMDILSTNPARADRMDVDS
ncbi:hypothetical protein PUNSTDRAFT_133262 [Punctularia strigosozonata HHB-11173 SS5]|uniref:uncharacterized protein n=1 Tax=Punctularia strigosozonata (strain HHB-11173) TaxID=741275 RepID=UPI00044184B7|nr:uncharacterized protein PUNSTDRAFT_133262 [Punctularia strigosozonata HHB-11173 SS5]EIN09470.1 hypothetical protein PUNSTDRAFT_133262 [Punctularia strigosozonata HHB-11173 SS5]